MNTLPPQGVLDRLSAHAPLKALLSLLRAGATPVDIMEAEGSFAAVLAAFLARELPDPGGAASAARGGPASLLVVVPTDQEAEALASDLSLLGVEADILPWWRTAAYRPASPRARAFGERAAALARFLSGRARVVVASQRAFVTPLPPREAFEPLVFPVEVGGSIDPGALAERLASYGYLRVPRVSLPGEFALRGEVLDLAMPGDEDAVRIVFEYDRVERVASFDLAGQAGLRDLGRAVLRPMKEMVWTKESVDALEAAASALPNCAGRLGPLLEELREKGEAKGEELWYALAHGAAGGAGEVESSVLDYLGEGSILFLLDRERLVAQEEAVRKEYAGLYRTALKDGPVPPPDRLLASFAALEARAVESGAPASAAPAAAQAAAAAAPNAPAGKRVPRLRVLRDYALRDAGGEERLRLGIEPPRSFFGNVRYFKEELASLLKAGYEVRVFAETDPQAERIRTLLKDYAIDVRAAGISAGFSVPALKLLVVQEGEIFGRRKRVPKSVKSARSSVIDTFVELNPGDHVVHVNYGIGRFASVERMRVLGNERDYVKIEYADDETVFVPIEQVNLVQRYIGNEGEAPRLDRLGSKSWENRKNKVRKSVEELAERLIRIYARRKAARGYAFPPDSDWQLAFEASFPYEETVDQLRCIEEVKADMESVKPMDRLVCGDVGYGKTEIAMRACFKAATAGKQVAFLAPTTILAEQHFENFK
ncbi:MAG: DEAD/DEAH box helicase, partial [Spirochaetaceae bacterium]|nr:DEAD/DEAH box helicase [Spirochaetaceae bacterium]